MAARPRDACIRTSGPPRSERTALRQLMPHDGAVCTTFTVGDDRMSGMNGKPVLPVTAAVVLCFATELLACCCRTLLFVHADRYAGTQCG